MASRSHSAGANCANWHTRFGGLCALVLLVVIGAVSACQEPRELPGLDPKTDDLPGQDLAPPFDADDSVDDGAGPPLPAGDPGSNPNEAPPAVPDPSTPGPGSAEPDADAGAGGVDAAADAE